jgi:hypothetical protein
VAAFGAQGLDIGAAGFGDPQPVQGEQRDQRMLWRWPKTGGDQHLAEFVAVQPGGMLPVVQPGTQDVSGRRTVKQVFFYRVPAEPGDRTQPAGDRPPGPAFGFQVTGEALDISAAALEQADVALGSVPWISALDRV